MAPWVWLREQLKRPESGTDCNIMSIFHWKSYVCQTGVLRMSDDVLQIKLEEVVGLRAVVLGAETLLSIKENAGD